MVAEEALQVSTTCRYRSQTKCMVETLHVHCACAHDNARTHQLLICRARSIPGATIGPAVQTISLAAQSLISDVELTVFPGAFTANAGATAGMLLMQTLGLGNYNVFGSVVTTCSITPGLMTGPSGEMVHAVKVRKFVPNPTSQELQCTAVVWKCGMTVQPLLHLSMTPKARRHTSGCCSCHARAAAAIWRLSWGRVATKPVASLHMCSQRLSVHRSSTPVWTGATCCRRCLTG